MERGSDVMNRRSGGLAAPAIPNLPKREDDEKERRRGGAVPFTGGAAPAGRGMLARWFGLGGGGAGVAENAAVPLMVRLGGGPGRAFGPRVVAFLTSNPASVVLTLFFTAASVYTLYALGMNANDDAAMKRTLFPVSGEPHPDRAEGGGGETSGLSFFNSANRGAAFDYAAAPGESPDAARSARGNRVDPAASKSGDSTEEGTKKHADALGRTPRRPRLVLGKLGGGGSGFGGTPAMGAAARMGGARSRAENSDSRSLEGMRRHSASSLSARRMSPTNRGKPGAMNQLRFANRKSQEALGATAPESRAFQAAEAFSPAPTAQGGPIAGAGLGPGGPGVGTGPSGYVDDAGGPFSPAPEEKPAPGMGKGKDKSPYSRSLAMAMALLMAASAIITVIGILALFRDLPVVGVIAEIWQKVLYGAAIAMAASASAIGASVAQQYGQHDQGLIVAVGGGITSAAAAAALALPGQASAWTAVLGGIGGIAASIVAMLSPVMAPTMPAGGGPGNASAAASGSST